ncbi:MAG: hypothetical protein SPJ23_01850 [Eubacteriales bacterium]|nr:hypothetical protein [Eubacteriales bacterium]
MKQKLRKYVLRKFRGYPKTKEIVDLREELYAMMCDKYDDALKKGNSNDEAYREALTLMQGYREAVREVESGSSRAALRKQLVSSLTFSALYFLLLTFLYLFLSLVTFRSFDKTWLTFVAGSFLYLVYFSCSMLWYASRFALSLLKRISVGVLFLSFVPVFFVFPSLICTVLLRKNIWSFSWLSVLVILLVWLIVDLFCFARHSGHIAFVIELITAGLVFTTIIFLALSFRFSLWNVAWLAYVAYLCVVAAAFWISENRKK